MDGKAIHAGMVTLEENLERIHGKVSLLCTQIGLGENPPCECPAAGPQLVSIMERMHQTMSLVEERCDLLCRHFCFDEPDKMAVPTAGVRGL